MREYCDVCWIRLPSKSHYSSHFNSEKHKTNQELQKKLNNDTFQNNLLVCKICCIVANTQTQLASHLESKNHFNKTNN